MVDRFSQVKLLRQLLEAVFPGWDGVDDERFQEREIIYKRRTVEKAAELLAEDEFRRLQAEDSYDKLFDRIEAIGQDNNLLWRSVPMAGDLNILYQKDLDRPAFADAFFELLYGDGDSVARLERYLEYVRSNKLPNKWTFPTYYLFMLHPETDLFIKPMITKTFLRLLDRGDLYDSDPSPEIYREILGLAQNVKEAFADEGVRDMIEVQSIIFVCSYTARNIDLAPHGVEHEHQLRRLLDECATEYMSSASGMQHIRNYGVAREAAAQNYEEILQARKRGEDVTDAVLLKLLPYADTDTNRSAGAWIHPASAVQADLKKWFENVGWVEPDDWPRITESLLDFIQTCVDHPETLESACKKFGESEHSRGFQTGMLSPILSALRPDEFILVNNKSRAAINYFIGSSLSQKLSDFSQLNTAGHFLINRFNETLQEAVPDELAAEVRADDVFDQFCHWLVAEKGFSFGKSRFWKISPGSGAKNWESCRDGNFISVGWNQLGNVSTLSRDEFDSRLAELSKEHENWGSEAPKQVWTLAHEIHEGDFVVANQGTSRVVGIGRVTGSYYYADGESYAHRLPVEWHDTESREVHQPGWRSTVIELNQDTFDQIREAPSREGDPGGPFVEKTFQLLTRLHENPTRDFYSEHKEAFEQYVEGPVQELLTDVGSLLPRAMREELETESGLFSRIAKNDYGRGGAWDFYWGAFYPKGKRRIAAAQLFVGIHREWLEYGFNIGEYGSDQRTRFLRNLRRHRDAIEEILTPRFEGSGLLLGACRREDHTLDSRSAAESVGSWLKNIEEGDIRAVRSVSREELLQVDGKSLRDDILRTFKTLFPLVVLAISDEGPEAIADIAIEMDEGYEVQPEYSVEQCSAKTGFDADELDRWVRAMQRKKQAILYGPPGTGKTFLARHLAKHIVGGGDGFIELVQFHPSYAYEDFMQGIRPETRDDGNLDYRMVPGRFPEFCRRARRRTDVCVLIIDEINRANLSRVFGELMYLLEYRDQEIPLGGGGTFRIPTNVRIIGTMNTADRSIALVDHALRRRFAFLKLQPRYQVLQHHHEDAGLSVEGLIQKLTEINEQIGDPNYYLGFTYFLDENLQENLPDIWRLEIEPYLEELFFDDRSRIERFRWKRVKDEISL